ncbi:hypothetical protein J6N69_06255 [bacterium]|nr:hypothetical protein [bacterium]MBP3846469.1 hypothetical protein [bacterium]
MNAKKIQKIDMYMKKISYYSMYADVLARILNEFIENGYENLRTNDMPNLTELLTKYVRRMRTYTINMKECWEFD